jgi:serine/threonine-protein phosphatase 2A regulatory subunit B'
LETLPKFKDVPQIHRIELFKAKLKACWIICNFKDDKADVAPKERKKNTLLELVDYLNADSSVFWADVLKTLMITVNANLFRTLGCGSPQQKSPTLDPDEDEPNLEEAWPHYQIVYELLLRFIMNHEMDPSEIREALTDTFILKILELFNSEDPRERDYLKTLLHRIYGRFMPIREFIRESIMNFFLKIAFEYEENNGISELLEMLCSIINGFNAPLKDMHIFFLEKALLPLHKVSNLSVFHTQLQNWIVQYLEKDISLSNKIISYLLKIWPITNAAKEVLFLTELEEIFEMAQGQNLSNIHEELFKRFSNCVVSNHFQVAERILFLINNDQVQRMITENKQLIFEILMKGLLKSSKSHWNQTVQNMTMNVMKSLMEIDSDLFEKLSNKISKENEEMERKNALVTSQWKLLAKDFS